jgi:hypothetical protein
MRVFIILPFLCLAAFSQSFPNFESEIFGPLKYEIGCDSYEYSHGATMLLYFSIKNISSADVDFYCPSPNLSVHKVVLRDHVIGEFPLVTLPMISTVSLSPGEITADTLEWDTYPATEDTIYRLWGKLNSWSSFTADSLFLELSFRTTEINERYEKAENVWFAPNPTNRFLSFNSQGSFELFDLSGKLILRGSGNTSLDLAENPNGTYLIRKAGSTECRKLLLMK